jgi:pimeloyl-ACP methyl ester carboxylesterase
VVPTLALCGAEDKRAEVMQDQARDFAGPYRSELVPGSSHFLQREQPTRTEPPRLAGTGTPYQHSHQRRIYRAAVKAMIKSMTA